MLSPHAFCKVRTMNPRHATAVLLIAFGLFALLVVVVVVGDLLVSAIRLYQASEHRLGVVRDKQGRVVRRVLPVLSPLWLAVFALVTLLVVIVLLMGDFDPAPPKAMKGRATGKSAEQESNAGEEKGPEPTG
jgi:hypothetical protein